MEKQVILATRDGNEAGYFSVWIHNKRVPGSYNPFECLKRYKQDSPHSNESLDHLDLPLLLEPLIKWNEE